VGLGAEGEVSAVSVRWPDGHTQEFGALAADRWHLLVPQPGR